MEMMSSLTSLFDLPEGNVVRVVVHIGCQFELLLKYSGAATVFQKIWSIVVQ